MLILLTLTSLLYPIPQTPGTLRGPGEKVWGGFASGYDLDGSHTVDLFDFAILQADWDCCRQNIVRPKRNQVGPCDGVGSR